MMTTEDMRAVAESKAETARDAYGEVYVVTYLVGALWLCCAEICDRLDAVRDELRHANQND